YDEALDEPGETVEHVVEREEGIRKDDTFGARVRDVALMPERDVLEPDCGGCADDASESAEAFRHHGVAFVRHRGGALLAAAERLLYLPNLRACEVPDLGREALHRCGGEAERREEFRMPVARYDLRGHRFGDEAETLAGDALHLGIAATVHADRPGDLADADSGERALDPVAFALELERPAGELDAERDRLGMDAVRPPDHHRRAVLFGAADHGRARLLEPVKDEQAGLPRLERERRVEHVGGRQSEVEPASVVAELLRNRVHERGEVVV